MTDKDKILQIVETWPDERQEAFNERVAIMQFDGKMSESGAVVAAFGKHANAFDLKQLEKIN